MKSEVSKNNKYKELFSATVIVAALGYFVDIYDLILFGVVREASLIDLQVVDKLSVGVNLLNFQMAGMLLGGIFWGVLGDKKGRLSVLFGSIILYSVANIANGFVQDINTYAILRFIAGVGLAGELGAGITLVTETLSPKRRGLGTMIVVVFGALGAVVAAVVANMFEWRTAYFVGGGLGILLLALRISVYESGMYKELTKLEVKKGNFLSLFKRKTTFFKYLKCILIGLPVWFTIGILVIFANDFAIYRGILDVNTSYAIMLAYAGLSLGDLLSGLLSQYLESRKKTTVIFIILNFGLIIYFLFGFIPTKNAFYVISLLLGVATGFWAIFVTIAAEQFGTNIRATVTTTVPNFVRGAVVPITSLFLLLNNYTNIILSALIVGVLCISLALWSILSISETFHNELNYIEEL
jgi:MFS family permease